VPARLGLGAYAGGYPVRLHEALADTFEAVARYCGDTEFGALARRYTAAFPPKCYNLNDVGRSFARFLRTDRLIHDLPFLADLADLEWKISRAFHAGLLPPADTAALAELTEDQWARVRLELQPGVGTVLSSFPIRSLWAARNSASPPTQLTAAGAEQVLVYRRNLTVRLELADRHEIRAVRALGRRVPLAVVLEAALRRGAPPKEVGAWPGHWQRLGILAGWDAS